MGVCVKFGCNALVENVSDIKLGFTGECIGYCWG